ncbi:trithorax group protein osa isoform X4 [Bradysia coprophila]|uniref:trithorax group protein osa isoform X4 n=1 Tax=Bradysia coprophila TaxID=38358 RepID=UPI00187D7C1A|nr:trithorax group protein osa isoform X4 [Bradysia coprophila]
MAQQQTENVNDIQSNENTLNESKNLQNGVENKNVSQNYRVNTVGTVVGMSEQKSKSPGAVGANNGNGGPPQPIDHLPAPIHPYGEHPSSGHLPPENKDDPHNMYGPPHPMHHPQPPQGYSRYHDPNMPPDMYGRYGGKPTSMIPPNRPPQRYMPGPAQSPQPQPGQQQPQGQTPTLNSLLQSHPPTHNRYPNSYDPHQQAPPPPNPSQSPQSQQQQQQQQQQQPQQQQPQQQAPLPPQGYQNWAPRPYSPQPYRPPPIPTNSSRGQSPYPPINNTGPYQAPQGAPPGASQYSPYPQRYPTPPGPPGSGPNHRPPYPPPPHQYSDPSRPWPPSGPSPAASPGPSGHPLPPQSPQHGPPQSPGAHAPSPSPQPPQPAQSPHQDSIGQNSNDSSSGVGTGVGTAPGTPNSLAMRPTPSPTGSSGSRSMSPAVGQQSLPMPPRPSSNHSQTSNQAPINNTNQSNQPQTIDPAVTPPTRPPNAPTTPTPTGMAAQGSYQTPPPQPPHMHGYKMGPSPGPGLGPQNNMPPYPPQSQQQYAQGNYSPRPQYPTNYGPGPTVQPPPTNSMPIGPGQYPGRPMPNHVAPHSQFPPYQQNWGPPAPQSGMNHVQGKNTPPPPPPGSSPRPLNHLKQHLLHKGGYGGNQSPTPPQGYGNGPGMHQPMGPPHHMAPSHGPMGPTNMGPPSTTPHNPPPPSGANSHMDINMPTDGPQDNGVSSSGSSSSSLHPVTSIVTTGPDGQPMDEASQQSTLSNASAASIEDPQCSTPKSRKNESYNQGHLGPPSASPGAHAQHEDFEMGSPAWQRTPASPVFNNHPPEPVHRTSKKSDSLCKLYDMDDKPERRGWLDNLLGFMEERRTPISACPTISKQPLDLYKLYMLVKERGGFVEVCKVTKSKTWKDIAGLLGIGASSSAAYTLRKHYTKNLFAFECHFDRGGVDPTPIIQQVEAGSKKKATKAASVPSPETNFKGSSNSQDSFPPPGSASSSMDGYGGYPTGYPPNTGPGYNEPQMQRPPSQSNSQSPHPGNALPTSGDNVNLNNPFDDPVGSSPRPPYQQGGAPYSSSVTRSPGGPYPGQQGGYSYGAPDQYGPPPQPPGQYPPTQGQFPPPNRTMYPPYGGSEGDTSAAPASGAPPPGSDPYRGYPGTPGSYPIPPQRPYNQQQPTPNTTSATPPTSGAPPQNPPSSPYPPPPQQFDYRPDQMSQNSMNSINMNSQLARQLVAPMSPAKTSPYHHNSPQPRRHPDFAKEPQPYPPSPYGQRPQVYGGWQSSAGGPPGQYNRGQYPPQPGPQQWNPGQRPPGQPGQWEHNRYPPQNQQQPYPPVQQGSQPQWGNLGQPTVTGPPGPPGAPMRPQQRGGKPFNMPPPPTGSVKQAPTPFPTSATPAKRDIVFPPDSVEATSPVLYRRKRICRGDIGTTDPWRIFMCLQSGLLSESTWALDVLNILLFDDSAVQYFGLANLPRLLTLLLDHFQKSLADMFDPEGDDRCGYGWRSSLTNGTDDDDDTVDLGQVTEPPNPSDRVLVLSTTTNYTLSSRKGVPVKIKEADDDIFVLETERSWDIDSNRNYQLGSCVGGDAWTHGHTQPHPFDHIISTFRAEIVNIPFARYIKSDKCKDRDFNKQTTTTGDINQTKTVSTTPVVLNNSSGTVVVEDSKNGDTKTLTKPVRLKEEVINDGIVDDCSNNSNKNKVAANEDDPMLSVKREQLDSDCREVDMELERIPNGPQSVETDDSKSSIKKEPKQFDFRSTVIDPANTLKRRRINDYEDECYARDEASLYLINESQDTLARRCICISNILRNMTFVPGNELIFANSETFLAILGKILLLHHDHPVRTQKTRNYDREDDTDFADSCSSLQGETEWWWDYLIQLRENMMVAVANIAGHMQLSKYEELITRPCLDGLLHWAVCPSAHGQDPFPSCSPNASLSPQRLALEALCKLCVTDANVDLVIATPPFSRLEKLCSVLTRHLCKNEDQVLREFSVNLLHYLAAADSAMARTVAMQSPCISYLVAFIEQAEQTALGVANQHGINFLRENPDSMGTSLDMLRRTAGTLLHLARHPDNRPLFLQQEQRLLGLVMSHILDQQVALIISRVLFQVSRGTGPMTMNEMRPKPYASLFTGSNSNNHNSTIPSSFSSLQTTLPTASTQSIVSSAPQPSSSSSSSITTTAVETPVASTTTTTVTASSSLSPPLSTTETVSTATVTPSQSTQPTASNATLAPPPSPITPIIPSPAVATAAQPTGATQQPTPAPLAATVS